MTRNIENVAKLAFGILTLFFETFFHFTRPKVEKEIFQIYIFDNILGCLENVFSPDLDSTKSEDNFLYPHHGHSTSRSRKLYALEKFEKTFFP